MTKLTLFIILTVLVSCKSPEKEIDFVTQIETAHLKNEYLKNDGLTQELGNANLSNIKFITTTKDFYTPSNSFLEIKN